MSDFIAIIRDARGNGVRADRVEGWHASAVGVRVHLSGGGMVDLRDVTLSEFTQRLDRALTASIEVDS